MKKLVILDYDHGNANSIKGALGNFNIDVTYSRELKEIKLADYLILPGVGHFGSAMQSLESNDLINILSDKIFNDKVPVLGICLGFQLMTLSSEEGNANGLSWINTHTKLIQPINTKLFKVPHIGWRSLDSNKSQLMKGIDFIEDTFYFCHKYYVQSHSFEKEDIFTFDKEYVGIYEKENIFGVQFHPEKSKTQGLKIFENFLSL